MFQLSSQKKCQGARQNAATVGDFLALPLAVCDDPQADPRGAGQARRVRVRGGGAVCARPLNLGVALAPLGPRDLPRFEHCQARQPGQLQAVPPRYPHLLPPPRHHWHGLARSGQRYIEFDFRMIIVFRHRTAMSF